MKKERKTKPVQLRAHKDRSGIHAFAASLVALLALVSPAKARENASFFEAKIRPLLIAKCYECHAAEKKIKGGLRLDNRAGWKTGGDSGPAIVPGKAAESLVYQAVSYEDKDLQMPPKGRLSSEEIEAIEQWIAMGAPDPRAEGAAVAKAEIDLEKGRQFWSFQPPAKPPLPKVKNAAWPRTEIDRFILATLEEKNLKPATEADKRALIRRASFDLTGLPPTPAAIAAFLRDDSPNAFEKVVDGLLASSHFGERWGRHWLDIARFAESSGGGRALIFPDAWRYRDYVVRAFNDDKPYDQFIREQIAGDLMSADSREERAGQITATGYLLLGPINYELQDKELLRMEVVDEQMTVVGKSLLGMSLDCARCHDHKFDPIPMRDYYALAGIFRSADSLTPGNVSGWETRFLPMEPRVEEQYAVIDRAEEELKSITEQVKEIDARLKDLKDATEPKGARHTAASGQAGIVIDDKDAERKGDWTSSTSTGKWIGSGYVHDAQEFRGHKHVRFRPTLPAAGVYEVRVSHAHHGNRASNARVTVVSADGEKTASVDQRKEPEVDGLWHSLGHFTFAKGTNGYVEISNKGADGVVIADAAQFIALTAQEPPRPPNVLANEHAPGEVDDENLVKYIVADPANLHGVVVDDTEARVIGQWQRSTHTPPHVGYSYIHDLKEDKGEKSVIYETKLPKSGLWEVRMSHCSNIRRSTNAPVTIRHADGETTIHVNEQEPAEHGKLFKTLGRFRFEKDQAASVTISNEGTDGKYVIADAVQFLNVAELEERETRLAELKEVRKQLLTKRRERDDLESHVKRLKRAKLPPREKAMAVKEAEDAGDYFMAVRGDIHKLGEQVPRGFIQVALRKDAPAPTIADKASGRLELADWLASRDNPLTARVMVNRIWRHLLGRGIVATPDNFGSTGAAPTHPELLDWLAVDFMDNGWSVKQTVKAVMLSRVYQLSSAPPTAGADADNFWLSRANRRRLDAESIRDAMLFISGELDVKQGGKTIPKGLKSEFDHEFTGTRRSLYSPVFRNNLEDIFEVFDFANPNMVAGDRAASAVPTQSLFLMNSGFVRDRSAALARRILQAETGPTADHVNLAYELVLNRPPTGGESKLARDFLGDLRETDALARLTDLCQSLLACVDFRFLN